MVIYYHKKGKNQAFAYFWTLFCVFCAYFWILKMEFYAYFWILRLIISDSKTPKNYWSDLKRKLKQEGSELHENLVQLKLTSSDGKNYVLNTKWLLRLVQSILHQKQNYSRFGSQKLLQQNYLKRENWPLLKKIKELQSVV